MLRYCWPGHLERLGEFANRCLPSRKPPENRAAGAVGECPEGPIQRLAIGNHSVTSMPQLNSWGQIAQVSDGQGVGLLGYRDGLERRPVAVTEHELKEQMRKRIAIGLALPCS